MRGRSIRRHHAERIRARCEEYVRNRWSGPWSYQTTWEWERDAAGNAVAQRHSLVPDWREKYEAWVKRTVDHEAAHRPHFCQMCRGERYDRLEAKEDFLRLLREVDE